jgi:hypothetical protein
MLIAALMTLHFVAGGGPVCAPLPDRDGDGRPELVMSTSSWGMKRAALLVFFSKSRKLGQVVEAPAGSLGFGDCLARVDPRLEDCLLVSDAMHSSSPHRYEGIVYRYNRDLKEIGRIEPEPDEEWFGIHLALGAFRSGDQLLAVQLEKTQVPEREYWVREWFAVYSLADHRRRGLIRGSHCADPNLSDRRGASLVCAWIPDCDGDGLEDLAIDMRDSVVLYSSKDLHPVRPFRTRSTWASIRKTAIR